jgi:CheY-like chemotaxis protein
MSVDYANAVLRPALSHPPASQPLVLAVDDNKDNLLVLTHALKLFGYAYISTQEGQSVLPLAQSHQPALILLDVVLRDLSGVDVLQHLKQDSSTKHIPVIAVTALTCVEACEQLLQLGCSDCLHKPYSLKALEALLRQHVNPALLAS